MTTRCTWKPIFPRVGWTDLLRIVTCSAKGRFITVGPAAVSCKASGQLAIVACCLRPVPCFSTFTTPRLPFGTFLLPFQCNVSGSDVADVVYEERRFGSNRVACRWSSNTTFHVADSNHDVITYTASRSRMQHVFTEFVLPPPLDVDWSPTSSFESN